jgi:imidazolonepropionase-like amidohydrolase
MNPASWIRSVLALALFASAASAPAQEPDPSERLVLYRGATLVDVDGGPPRPDIAILVRGERIEAVEDATDFRVPAGAEIVDLDGHYVVPGFINTHVHLATPPDRGYAMALLRRDVYGGVTAVRSMADDARAVADLARATRVGEIPGPDIVYPALFAGAEFFHDPRVQSASQGETAGAVPWMREVEPGTDLAEAVTLARGSGASAIKIYANLDAATVARIVAEAHRQGLPAWAHGAVFPASPLEVAESGADGLSHACMLAYQAQAMPATYHDRADVDEARFANGTPAEVQAVFAAMRRRGSVLDATLYVYETIERMRSELPEGQGPPIYCSSALAGRIAGAAHAAGVEISVGTDAPAPPDEPYPAVQREMELLVAAGLSPRQALRAATRIGARGLGRESEMGAIAPGMLANLVFLAADPSQDIAATRQVVLTVKRGLRYWRRDYVPPSPAELGERGE